MNDELEPTAAERALAGHLALLQQADRETLDDDSSLVRRIVRTARWQGAVRAPLRVAGMIGGSVLDGVLAFAGAGREQS